MWSANICLDFRWYSIIGRIRNWKTNKFLIQGNKEEINTILSIEEEAMAF